MAKILLSTTSFQDTPGPHHALLESAGLTIHRERGPLTEAQMLALPSDIDAFLCGDDVISRKVLEKFRPRLKVISKYGIGIDKIDVAATDEFGIPLSNCPGVNHTTVAEHVFALLLALVRQLVPIANAVAEGNWKRLTGHEIMGKTIGIVGLGRIGKEVAIRAKAFGMKVIGYDVYWPEAFAAEHGIERMHGLTQLFERSDIISLHTNLTEETRDMVNEASLQNMKKGVYIINCARGELVNTNAIKAALDSGYVAGYGADVLDEEPPRKDHPLLGAKNCIITSHIGSRTYESVERQAMMATENLLLMLRGQKPHAQVNKAPIPPAIIK